MTTEAKKLLLMQALQACGYIPSQVEMEEVIAIVQKYFPANPVNEMMLSALKNISVNSEEHPFVKKIADKAINEAESISAEYNANPII